MKSVTMRSMFVAAALAVAAVSASAQTYKADIPMAFRAGETVLTAGSYQFDVLTAGSGSGHAAIAVRNTRTSASVLVLTSPGSDVPKAWKTGNNPVIGFECLGSDCRLRQMWNGRDESTVKFPGHKLTGAEAERAATITVALTKAD